MAERSRAYVSDAFAHIPPWCNGSTRVFGTLGCGFESHGGHLCGPMDPRVIGWDSRCAGRGAVWEST